MTAHFGLFDRAEDTQSLKCVVFTLTLAVNCVLGFLFEDKYYIESQKLLYAMQLSVKSFARLLWSSVILAAEACAIDEFYSQKTEFQK